MVDPQMPGIPHPEIHDWWLFATPSAIVRLPKFVIIYTIDRVEGVVTLWNLYRI
jgi:hypothetical protein